MKNPVIPNKVHFNGQIKEEVTCRYSGCDSHKYGKVAATVKTSGQGKVTGGNKTTRMGNPTNLSNRMSQRLLRPNLYQSVSYQVNY